MINQIMLCIMDCCAELLILWEFKNFHMIGKDQCTNTLNLLIFVEILPQQNSTDNVFH